MAKSVEDSSQMQRTIFSFDAQLKQLQLDIQVTGCIGQHGTTFEY